MENREPAFTRERAEEKVAAGVAVVNEQRADAHVHAVEFVAHVVETLVVRRLAEVVDALSGAILAEAIGQHAFASEEMPAQHSVHIREVLEHRRQHDAVL